MESYVDKILKGVPVKEALKVEETAYDRDWEQSVWKAAKEVFAADKKLWDLMVFAPDQYKTDDLQDVLNAFSKWYQHFLKVKED